jgi:metal-responsive CopG/Arc/MetJ family transcriptional regulator
MKHDTPAGRFEGSSRNVGKKPTSSLISVRLPEDLLERLAGVGNEEGLSMSDTIRLVLERGIRASTTQKRKEQ